MDLRHWRHCYNNVMYKMPNACDNNMRRNVIFPKQLTFFFFSCIYYNKLPKKLFIVFIFLIFSLGIRFIAEMDISCIQFLYMLLLLAILDNQLHFLYVRMNVYFVLFRKLVRACVTDISKNRVDFWKN